jgi:hypothetical protein
MLRVRCAKQTADAADQQRRKGALPTFGGRRIHLDRRWLERCRLAERLVGLARLAADPFAGKRPAGADDLNRQRGMREGDTGGDLHQLHGPDLDSAIRTHDHVSQFLGSETPLARADSTTASGVRPVPEVRSGVACQKGRMDRTSGVNVLSRGGERPRAVAASSVHACWTRT